jgi:hypothetical protein
MKRQELAGVPFIPESQFPEAVDPTECALHQPAVTPKALARFHTTTSDTRLDSTRSTSRPAASEIEGFIRVHLVRSAAWTPTSSRVQGGDSVEKSCKHQAVVCVRT